MIASLTNLVCQNHNYADWKDLDLVSSDFLEDMKLAEMQLGVIVRNRTNFETKTGATIGGEENWCPVYEEKKTLCGKLDKFGYFNGSKKELDWNLYVMPDSNHQHMIDRAISHREALWVEGFKTGGALGPKVEPSRKSLVFWWPEGVGKFNPKKNKIVSRARIQVEGEITPKKNISTKNNPFEIGFGIRNPIYETKKTELKVGMYGPFVIEKRHNYRPEIHPCEAIWWEKDGKLHLFSSHDESERFHINQESVLDHEWRIPFWMNEGAQSIQFEVKVVDAKNPIELVDLKEMDDLIVEVNGREKVSVRLGSLINEGLKGIVEIYFDNVSKLDDESKDLVGELVIVINAGGVDGYGQMHLEVVETN